VWLIPVKKRVGGMKIPRKATKAIGPISNDAGRRGPLVVKSFDRLKVDGRRSCLETIPETRLSANGGLSLDS
jgi:hypothetical protein